MGKTGGICPVLVAVLAQSGCIYETLKALKFLTFCLMTVFSLTALISWRYKWFFRRVSGCLSLKLSFLWKRKSGPQPPLDILIFHLFRLWLGLCCSSETFLLIFASELFVFFGGFFQFWYLITLFSVSATTVIWRTIKSASSRGEPFKTSDCWRDCKCTVFTSQHCRFGCV